MKNPTVKVPSPEAEIATAVGKAKTEVGARVGAMQSANEATVKLFGYGVYEGDHVPTRGTLKELNLPNPRIKLDDGQIVYGCECWWGPEDKVKANIGNRPVQVVPCPKD